MAIGARTADTTTDLIDQLGAAVVAIDRERSVTLFNAAAEQLYGYTAAEVVGQDFLMLVPELTRELALQQIAQLLSGGSVDNDAHALCRDGQVRKIVMFATPVRDGEGTVTGAIAVMHDNTDRNLRERQLAMVTQLLGETDTVAVIGVDRAGVVTLFNEHAERMLGYTAAEVVGELSSAVFHDQAEMIERARALGTAVDGGRIFQRALKGHIDQGVHTYVRKDGSKLQVLLSVRAVFDRLGEIDGFIGMARDVAQLRQAEIARVRAEERFRIAFEHAPIGLAILGLGGEEYGVWTQTNPTLARMLGYEPGELDGAVALEITHPDDRELTRQSMDDLEQDTAVVHEKRLLCKDGTDVWVYMSSVPVPSVGGAPPAYAVTQILDISERRQFEQQLHYLAEHDALTNLFNRRRFESELARVLADAEVTGESGALLMIDLDGFKAINDRFGHPVGDDLVRHIGVVLRETVRKTDFVARLGGDEFAVILRSCDPVKSAEIAEKLLASIRVRGMVVTTKETAHVTASVGLALYGGGFRRETKELVVEADNAMYEAKAAGRNCFMVHKSGNGLNPLLADHDSWFARLRRALDEDRLLVYAQPIVPIDAEGPLRYELLVRMAGDNGEVISPGTFLPHAERFDLIGELDRWMVSRAILLLHRHAQAGNNISLSVNLSGKTMSDLGIAEDIGAFVKQCPIPPGRLVVEITETAAIVNIERARELSQQLRAFGCLFALDDFGSGFSSLYYLKHLDFDYIKIDGEFVKGLASAATDRLIVRAVVDLARGLGTHTVAEYVSDAETLALLRELGVDYGQGYHLGRPGPAEKVLPSLRRT